MTMDRDFVAEALEMETEEERIAFMETLSVAEIAVVEQQIEDRLNVARIALLPIISAGTELSKMCIKYAGSILKDLNLDP